MRRKSASLVGSTPTACNVLFCVRVNWRNTMFSLASCCRRLSMAWSVSARIASSVTTCKTRCMPPRRSNPRCTFCLILASEGGKPAKSAIDRMVTPTITNIRLRILEFIFSPYQPWFARNPFGREPRHSNHSLSGSCKAVTALRESSILTFSATRS